MAGAPVRWPDEVDEVIRGDLTAAAAYVTPAGGAVVAGVCPMGLGRREAAGVGFTTSLGFGKKLERIIADPHVALAYHSREHGFSASPAFVLAQGTASVDIRPSRERLEAIIPQGQRYVGQVMRGPVWDRLLREYYYERVFVDITVARIAAWPDLSASGDPTVYGAAWPGPPGAQAPPKNGTGPRVDVDRAAGGSPCCRTGCWPTRGPTGSRWSFRWSSPGMTRRACGWSPRTGCSARRPPRRPARPRLPATVDRTQPPGPSPDGWTSPATAPPVYAPHTSKGFVAPPRKKLLLVSNGLFAKYGLWQARRQGTADRLEQLAAEKGSLQGPD